MNPLTAALTLLLLAPCGCARGDASGRAPALTTTATALTTTATALAEPMPADLPPRPAEPAAAVEPEPAPSAEEVAAFHAPVPK